MIVTNQVFQTISKKWMKTKFRHGPEKDYYIKPN